MCPDVSIVHPQSSESISFLLASICVMSYVVFYEESSLCQKLCDKTTHNTKTVDDLGEKDSDGYAMNTSTVHISSSDWSSTDTSCGPETPCTRQGRTLLPRGSLEADTGYNALCSLAGESTL